jgi:Flp pilus assembly protein TadD
MLQISEEQPEVLMQLARMRLDWGQDERAIPLLRSFQSLEPDDYVGRKLLADAYRRTGRAALALAQYRGAARLRPELYQPLARMAWIHATHPDPKLRNPARAMQLAERAADRMPLVPDGNPLVPEALAAAHASSGQFERAADIVEQAIDRLPENQHEDLERLERQLAGYRAGRSPGDGRHESTSQPSGAASGRARGR